VSAKLSPKDMMLENGAIKESPHPENLTASSYIDGRWVEGEGSSTKVLNPTTGETLGYIHDCSNEQIKAAFAAARKASKYWAKENQHRKQDFSIEEIGILEKREILDRFAHLLEKNIGALTLLIAQEMGKTAFTAYADIRESIHTAEHYRDIVHNAMAGEFRDAQAINKKAFTKRFPYGVVLGIIPFNFIALCWWKVCAAITAGNAVVIKASEDIPFTVNATVCLFHKAVEDVLGERARDVASLVQVLQGKGEIVGNEAATNGDYDMLSFTGGTETASILQVICAKRNKRFHMESGGHAAIFVLDDFDLEKAADEIVLAAFGDAGQRCTSTKAVFAEETIYDRLLELVIERAKRLRIGDPANVDTKIGPIINKKAFEGIVDQMERTMAQLGRDPVLGGIGFLDDEGDGLAKALEEGFNVGEELESRTIRSGNFLTPTIFTDVPYGIVAMDEEIFGPVLVFNKISGVDPKDVLENAVDLVNQSKYGLSSAGLTKDIDFIFWAFDHTHTGVWYGKRGTTGAEVPGYFSVVKSSGSGHEAYGIDEYSWVKQGWLDLHPTTRLAQTGSTDKIKRSMNRAQSLFS